ncbi:hypothetical protein L249_0040, partial [Ophiocordyceps polyrhachis-furcata BCC 54312]
RTKQSEAKRSKARWLISKPVVPLRTKLLDADQIETEHERNSNAL